MHRAAFHFIKALNVPSQVIGKHKHLRKGAEDDGDISNKEADDIDNIGNEEVDNINIDTSMEVDASANDMEAMPKHWWLILNPVTRLESYLPLSIRSRCQVRMFTTTLRTPSACTTSNKLSYICGSVHTGEALLTVCLHHWRFKRYVFFFNFCAACWVLTLRYRQLTIFVSLQIVTRISHRSRTKHGLAIGCRERNGNLLSWYTIAWRLAYY